MHHSQLLLLLLNLKLLLVMHCLHLSQLQLLLLHRLFLALVHLPELLNAVDFFVIQLLFVVYLLQLVQQLLSFVVQ